MQSQLHNRKNLIDVKLYNSHTNTQDFKNTHFLFLAIQYRPCDLLM